MEEQDRYITIKEAAERYKVSEGRLYIMCKERRVPHVRIGGRIRIDTMKLKRDAI